MEEENAPTIVPDQVFLDLLQRVRQNDSEGMLQLIELFKGDIVRLSRFIHMPVEDATAQIILEFLEFVKNSRE